MPSKNSIRGSTFEREIVHKARDKGFRAERAYGSNGRALGESEEVDLLIDRFRVQAKRRKKLASFLQIPEGADAVVFRQDRSAPMALITLDTLLDLLEQAKK